MRELDLPGSPKQPADSDVFRRAFQNGVRRTLETDDPNVTENLLVRDVAKGSDRLVKRIVSELVDAAGETLSYTEAIDITWEKAKPDEVVIRPVDCDFNPRALVLATTLRDEYFSERGNLTSQSMRDILSRVLATCSATSVREGGAVYFVSREHADTVARLRLFAEAMPGVTVRAVPLPDTAEQRDMVREAYHAEATSDVDRLAAEMSELLDSETVSSRRFQSISVRVEDARKKMLEYSDLLETEQADTAVRLQILTDQLVNLLGKVD
jgi:hypothetical protein